MARKRGCLRSPFRRAEPLARPSPRTRAGPQCLLSRASALCPDRTSDEGRSRVPIEAGALRHRVPPEIERRGRRRESHAPRPAHAGLAHTPDRRAEPVSLGRSSCPLRCSSPPSCGRSSSSGSRIASGSRSHGLRWNSDERAFEVESEFIPSGHLPGARRADEADRMGTLVHDIMRPLQEHLIDAGCVGLVRQAGLGNPVAGEISWWIAVRTASTDGSGSTLNRAFHRSCLSTPWHSSGSTCRACCRVDGFSSTTLTFPCFAATWPATEPH